MMTYPDENVRKINIKMFDINGYRARDTTMEHIIRPRMFILLLCTIYQVPAIRQ